MPADATYLAVMQQPTERAPYPMIVHFWSASLLVARRITGKS